jgi:hypothetical protein
MADITVNARWQAAMADLFPSLRDARPDKDTVVLDGISHLEIQLDAADAAVPRRPSRDDAHPNPAAEQPPIRPHGLPPRAPPPRSG